MAVLATVVAMVLAPLDLPNSGIAAAQGQPSRAAMVVQGNRRIEADDIRARFPAGPDGRLDGAAINAGIKALYATGLFTDVKVERRGERLTVIVAEAPVIDRVQFEGNKSIKDNQLAGEIQSKPQGPFNSALVQADVAHIVDIYRHNGHYDVKVDPKTIARGRDRVDLVYDIQEGAKTTIKTIAFSGNGAFPPWRLKSVIKSRESWLLSFLTGNDTYDADRIEADRDLLRRFYLDHGYADVQITAARAEYDPKAKGFVVTFAIDEGPQFRLGRVDIHSQVPAVDGGKLASNLLIKSGGVYDADAIDKTSDDLTVAITKGGYPFAVVKPQIDRHADARLIDVTYSVEDGPRSYVERIEIHGNVTTRDYVIRREFEIAEGDPYNRNLIDRAKRRLKRLNFFKTVKITTRPGSAPDRVVIDVQVEEDKTADLNFGIGYSTADGVVGNASVSDRNLLGLGVGAKMELTMGQYVQGVTLGYSQPYFLGTSGTLGLDLFYKNSMVSSYQSYGSEVYGGTFKFSAPITDGFSAEAHYSLYNQSTSLDPTLFNCANPPSGGCASLPVQQAALAGPAWVSMIGSTLTYSTLDNPLNPTSGMRNDLREDVAGLGGDVQFLRTTDDLHYYQPITSDITAIGRVQGGYISGWGGQAVPLSSSFFGGPQLVRGFAPNGFGPRDLTSGTTMDNVGGTRYWATSAELQSSIPYLPPDLPLKVGVFADAGSVFGYGGPSLSSSFALADGNTIRSSLGASLIWSSPFGPLRLDYAYPITKASYDVTQRLNFGAGPF